MAALLAATLVMSAGMVLAGTPMRAVFDVYVSLISAASVWMAWRSIADRRDIGRYLGWPYRLICAALGAYGLFLLAMVPKMGAPARMAAVGAPHRDGCQLRRDARVVFDPRRQRRVPALKEPWVRTFVLIGWMLSALIVRLWAARRFLGDETVLLEQASAHDRPAGPWPRDLPGRGSSMPTCSR